MNIPVKIEEFSEALKSIITDDNKPLKIAIAVSGGGDSMALAILAHEWVKINGGELIALTIDHGLRIESSAEANEVHKFLTSLGIKHEVLNWEGEKPKTRIEEEARKARYNLLIARCKELDFYVLAVAHNIEDQIETFWMRLSHGSGLDGLSAMSRIREVDGVSIIRPLMSFSRKKLRATCEKYNIKWIEDPSNQDKKYLRVKLRKFESFLFEEGLTPKRLTKTIKKLENSRQALEYLTDIAIKDSLIIYPEGYALLKKKQWLKYPIDIRQRVLSQALQTIFPKKYPSGFDIIEEICNSMVEERFKGRTLSGCEIFPSSSGDIFISREENNIEPAIFIKENVIWDKRFICSAINSESLKLGTLGEEGLSELRKNKDTLKSIKNLPFKIKKLLPAIWEEDILLAVPHIGYYSDKSSKDVAKLKVIFVNY